jgi:ribonuclease J
MMVDFQFMSGLNTIGGNIIDICSERGRVIFDYGEILDPTTGSLPDLSSPTENTAIFISHLHIDHMGSLKFVPKEVPIYMSQASYDLYHQLVEVGEELPIEASIYSVDYQEVIEIGDIQVTAKQSDHDIRGASAFFVETPDVKFIYSGDVQLTGNDPESVEKWMEEANKFQPDILLLEGTTFSFEEEREHVPEKALYTYWQDLLKNNPLGIIFLNSYIRATERLLNLSKHAKASGRHMVLEPKYAHLLKEIENYNDTYVLQELDTEGTFKDRWISLAAIQKEPAQYVVQNSFEHRSLMDRFDSGIYGHSNGEPLGDYDERYEELLDTIETNHFVLENLNSGGHATQEDLIKIAQTVDAKVTIPWHSFKPEALAEALTRVGIVSMLPELDVVYSINRLNKVSLGEKQ